MRYLVHSSIPLVLVAVGCSNAVVVPDPSAAGGAGGDRAGDPMRNGSVMEPPMSTEAVGCRARSMVVSTLGIILGASSANHGVFETLQGNARVPGIFIDAIGPAQRMWKHGAEGAFTLWPTFLASGIASIVIGLALALWSVFFIRRRFGSAVFLGLSIASLLSGGGVAQILIFSFTWVLSLLMRHPPGRAIQAIAERRRRHLVRFRSLPFVAAILLSLLALEIGVAGFVPGLSNPDVILEICFASILTALALFGLAYLFSSAADAAGSEPQRSLPPGIG